MKTEFKDFRSQMIYINKMIARNTNLKKECQYCGKPAQIRYSYDNPFEVQFICTECKKKYKLNFKKSKGLASDIPVINIKEHFSEEKKARENKMALTDDNIKKIKSLLKSKDNKISALSKVGLTLNQYDKLIKLYKENIDNKIDYKLKKVFNKNRANKIKNSILNAYLTRYEHPNNLYKIKLERNLSNREIVELSNNRIKQEAICIICGSKSNPKITTKCILAESLNVSIADIFPDDYLFKDIYSYRDYCRFMDNLRKDLRIYIYERKLKKEKHVVDNISKDLKMPKYKIYEFLSGNLTILHDDLAQIVKYINK